MSSSNGNGNGRYSDGRRTNGARPREIRPPATKRAQTELRRDRVMSLLLAGAQRTDIAKALGCGVGTVTKDIAARLNAASAADEATAQYRELHRLRIERMLVSWWEDAQTDHVAARTVIMLLDRQAKLLGLDAPQQHVVETDRSDVGIQIEWGRAEEPPQMIEAVAETDA